jgi:hypothetical protein
MFRILTIFITVFALVLSIVNHPLMGWILLCLLDLSIAYQWRILRRRYRPNFVRGLSVQANIFMHYYGHYFARPEVSKDFTASAAILQLAGFGLAVIGFFQHHLWAIVLGAVNWFVMAEAALAFSPLYRLKGNPGLQEAFDEVKEFFRRSSAREWAGKEIEITSGSGYNNTQIGAV